MEQMNAATASMASQNRQPWRTASATRSWSAVKRIADSGARREATFKHFEKFPPVLGSR